MMDAINKNIKTIVLVVIFVLVMVSYNIISKSDSIPPDEEQVVRIGDDLLKTYEELQSVTLSQSILSSAGYLLLLDFSTPIPDLPVGRPNPFDVIGRDVN